MYKRSLKPQLNLILPDSLKTAIFKASTKLSCSQSEIVRLALFDFLKDITACSNQSLPG